MKTAPSSAARTFSATGPPGAAQKIPEIPGLDSPSAVVRLGGNVPLYLKTLRLLHLNLPKYQAELADAADAGDIPRLRHAAHTIKGLVATIGATSATLTAETLEHAATPDAPPPDRELSEALLKEIHTLAARLDAFAASGAAPVETPPAPDTASAESAATFSTVRERLLSLLDASDAMALACFMDNRNVFASGLPAATLSDLEKCLYDFAYDEAIQLLTGQP